MDIESVLERVDLPADLRQALEAATRERDLALSELAEARAKARYLDAALSGAHLGCIGVDLRTGCVTANDACIQMLGYARDEVVPSAEWWAARVHPDDQPRLAAAWQDHVEGRTATCEMEGRFLTSGGGWRLMRIGARVVDRADDGAPLSLAGTLWNAQERYHTQHDLVASEVRYRRLFETAQDGILLLDAGTGAIVDANPFIVEMLGHTYDEVVGRKLWEVGAFADAEASEAAFRELQKRGYVRYENLPLESKDGSRIHVEFVSNVYRVDGQAIIQCNVRDITARRRAEQALEELRASLEVLVDERTAELAEANEALREAMAERERTAERERALIVGERMRIAREIHDTLAQGLVSIIIQLEVAEDALEEGPEVLKDHLLRARELARESLGEARRSVWALRPQALDESDLFGALLQMTHQRVVGHVVQVEFACTGRPRPLPAAVEDGLLRISQEALANALRHAEARRVSVALTYTATWVEVSVKDDGKGFEISDMGSRRGFGLRSMQERAESIGGRCEVSSASGTGAVVRVVVPVAPEEAEPNG